MNRRQFTQRLAALFATPALPAQSVLASATVSTSATLPSGAVFWAKYLNSLHDTCTPDMLGNMLNISGKAARHLHRDLIAKGVIPPTSLVHSKPTQTRGVANPKTDRKSAEPTRLTTRMADEQDIPALTEIWHAGWHEAHAAHVPEDLTAQRTLNSFADRLQANLGQTLVIGPAGAPLGFSMLRGHELYQIYLSPLARGRGLGDALLAAAERKMAKAGICTAVLHAIPQNQRAIAFYRRNGWTADQVIEVSLETLADPFPLACLEFSKTLKTDTNQIPFTPR